MKQIYTLKEPIGKISTPKDIFNKIKKFKVDYSQENVIIFYLNTANQVVTSSPT